jgi:hypothetical protein
MTVSVSGAVLPANTGVADSTAMLPSESVVVFMPYTTHCNCPLLETHESNFPAETAVEPMVAETAENCEAE